MISYPRLLKLYPQVPRLSCTSARFLRTFDVYHKNEQIQRH